MYWSLIESINSSSPIFSHRMQSMVSNYTHHMIYCINTNIIILEVSLVHVVARYTLMSLYLQKYAQMK